jgi:hypothetical protein
MKPPPRNDHDPRTTCYDSSIYRVTFERCLLLLLQPSCRLLPSSVLLLLPIQPNSPEYPLFPFCFLLPFCKHTKRTPVFSLSSSLDLYSSDFAVDLRQVIISDTLIPPHFFLFSALLLFTIDTHDA